MTRAWLTLVLAACGGTTGAVPGGPPPPADAGVDVDAGCTASSGELDAAPAAPWTKSLWPALLGDMRRHASGDMILAGSFSAAMDQDGVHLDAPETSDPFVFRVDRNSGKLVWATSFHVTASDKTKLNVASALAVDGDAVYVVGSVVGAAISFGGSDVLFPPADPKASPARSFVAKLSAVDGSIAWGISFDASRTPFDANVDADCRGVVASAGEIDVGCAYVGARFGLGGFYAKYAPPPSLALAVLHLVDGPSPTLTRASAFQSASDGLLLTGLARAPSGDVYFVSPGSGTIVDLGDATTVLDNAAGIVAKLTPSGSVHAVASPIPLHIRSKLRWVGDGLVLTGVGVGKLDPGLSLEWTIASGALYGAQTVAPFGYYVAHSPSVLAIDGCGKLGLTYSPMPKADPGFVTIDGLDVEDQGNLVIAGTYDTAITFDDGTTSTSGYSSNTKYLWSGVYFARRPTF